MAASLPYVSVSLSASKIPGAEFIYENIENHSVVQLKRWLQCRGLPTKGKKQELIQRCQEAIVTGNDTIKASIDRGVHLTAKADELRQKVLEDISNKPPLFPVTGWRLFPSNNIPENFSYHNIYEHLVHSAVFINSDGLTMDTSSASSADCHTGKSLHRGRIYFKSGHVLGMEDVLISSDYYCLKANVLASYQTDSNYKVLVMLNTINGKVVDASCECKASSMGRCSHVGAVLYALEDYTILFGFKPPACTSVLCSWNQGRKKKAPGKIFSKKYTSKLNHLKRFDFDPRRNIKITTEEEKKGRLNALLQNLQHYSAQNQLMPSMWEKVLVYSYSDYKLSHCHIEQLKENVQFFIKNITPSGSTPTVVPGTEGQAQSQVWTSIRWCFVTASKCQEYSVEGKKPATLFKMIKNHLWRQEELSLPALTYGRDNEKSALELYAEVTNFAVEQTGLWVNPRMPGLAASPDGLVTDNTCQDSKGLVEVKCPLILSLIHPLKLEENLNHNQIKNFCCRMENSKLKLKITHRYYSQIQMQMAVTERKWCDFVIWSPLGMSIERINFSEKFWLPISEKLSKLHKNFIIPEYFEQRVPRKLMPLDLNM